MAKYSNTVAYELRTTLDASGIAKLQGELRGVQTEIKRLAGMNLIGKQSSQEAVAEINKIEKAMTKAFNPTLGMLNFNAFNKELKKSGGQIDKWGNSFNLAGVKGQQALVKTIAQLGQFDRGLTSVSKTTDKVFNTLGNTVRWGVIASGFQSILNSAHEAVDYIKELDRSLNDIRIVSEYTAQDMREFSLYANEAAQALGQTTVAYTDASLIFAQQGFNLEDSNKLAEMVLKVANTTGQATEEVSEQVTSWMNGYQMSIDQVGETLDKVTRVAAVGAADTEELMTAASKVASVANMLGVSEDQLISQMSTIISVTREAPENIGNSLKTIYARLGDLKMGETLEDGTDLGKLGETLAAAGVNIKDDNDELRNMGDILEELMEKWSSFDKAQQQALSVQLAGKYQLSRFTALMQNKEMYDYQLSESENADGFLDRTQDIYMESLAAKEKELQAATEGLISIILDPDVVKPFIEALTEVVDLMTQFVDSIGGAQTLLTGLGTIATKAFSKNIAGGINNFITNRKRESEIADSDYARRVAINNGFNSKTIDSEQGASAVKFIENMSGKLKILSEEERKTYNQILSSQGEIVSQLLDAEEELETKVDKTNHALRDRLGIEEDLIKKDADGKYNFGQAQQAVNLAYDDQLAKKNKVANPETQQQLQRQMSNFIGQVSGAQKTLDKFRKGNIDAGKAVRKLGIYSKQQSQILEAMKKTGAMTDSTYERLKKTLLNFDQESLKEIIKDGKIVEEVLNEIGLAADRAQRSISTVQSEQYEELGITDAQKTDAKVDTLKADKELGDQQMESFDTETTSKEHIQTILNTVAAIGELSFAWQSFQSLGSIWANTDISTGEKIQQTIMNLSFAIPMAINGFMSLEKGLKETTALLIKWRQEQALTNAIMQLAEKINLRNAAATGAANIAMAATGPAGIAAAVGTTAAAAGTMSLAGAVSALTAALLASPLAPFIAVAIAVTGVMVGLAAAAGRAAEQQKAYEKSLNDSIEKEQAIQKAIKNSRYQELIKTYEETKEVSEELKQAAIELAEQLDIVGASVLIEGDNFAYLNGQIQDSIVKHKNYNKQLLEIKQQELRQKQEQGTVLYSDNSGSLRDTLSIGVIEEVGNAILGQDNKSLIREDLGIWAPTPTDEDLKDFAFKAATRQNQLLKERTELNQQLIDKQTELDKATADGDKQKVIQLRQEKQSLVNRQTNVEKLIGAYGELFSREELGLQEAIDVNNALAAIRVEEIIPDFSQVGDGADIMQRLLNSNIPELQNYFKLWDTYEEKLAAAMALVNDELGQQKLSLEQMRTEQTKSFAEFIKTNQNKITLIDDNGKATSLNAYGELGDEEAKELAENAYNSLKEAMAEKGMTENEQIKLLATFDSTPESFYKIQEQVDEFNASTPLKFQANIDTTGSFSYTEEQMKELLQNTDTSESSFKRMTGSFFNKNEDGTYLRDSGFEQRIMNLDAQKNQAMLENNKEKLIDIRKEYDRTKEAAEDITAMSLEMNKGIEDLSSGWENLGDIVMDESKKGSQAWFNAIGKIDESLSQVLNIDIGSLSNNFYIDPENLELIKRIAEEDYAAIDELRAKATEDLIVNLDVDTSKLEDGQNVEELITNLQTQFQEFADNNPAMNIGDYINTELDTSGFMASLDEMLQAGQISKDQLQNILNSYGMSGSIKYDEGMTTVPEYTYEVETLPPKTVPTAYDENGTVTASTQVASYKMRAVQSGEKKMKGLVPHLEGATYAGPGISNVIPQTQKSSGSGGKKGSGGGSSKSYTPKKKDKKDPDIDRYERVNTQLEYVGNEFEKINKEHDRAKGWNLTDVMEEEIGLLEREIDLYKEKYKIQQQEATELQNTLSQNYGATFDEEGLLTNYASIHRKLYNDYNNLIDRYNNTATEEGQNALEEQIEAAEKKLSGFEETYSRYDELVAGDMKDTINTLKDLEDQIEDIRIEAFNTQIETLDNIRELNDALFEFNELMKVGTVDDLDDPFKGLETSASKLGAYFDSASLKANEYYDNLIARSKEKLADPQVSNEYKKYLQDEIALMEEAKRSAGDGTIEKYGSGYFDMAASNLTDIMAQFDQFLTTGTSSIFGENEAALYEAGQEVFMQFKDVLADFWSDAQGLRDKILDCIDDVGERIEERRAQYEAITDELDHQRNIIEMLHGDKAYDEILNVLNAQQRNYDVSIGEMKQTLDYWTQMRNGLREGSEEWKAVNEKIEETQQNLNELVESSLENLTEIYTQNVNKMLDAWTNSALGNDLEWIEEEWELINRNADYYLDQTNAAYETQKLQNEYLKLLDGSNDLHIQQMITEQMKDQLSYLREKKNISEYDVAYANAQLEILQKRIALEEAQRNKNQIKLRRDSQGNYSYVYTADQEDIAEKEGDLLDAQNNAYNLSKEQMRQTQADSLSALGDAKNLLNNIWTDANLTLEEKQKRTKTIIDSLKEYLAGTSEQLGESQKNIINDFIGMAEMMADENADRLSDVYTEIINGNNDAFFQIDERWSTSLTNWLNTVDEFNNSTDSMFNDLTEKCQNWETATKEVGEQVGQNFDSMAESVDNVRQKTDDLAASQSNFINQLKSDAGVVLDYEDTLNSYIAKIADAENEMNKYAQQVKELQGKLTQKEAENASLVSQLEQKSNLGGSGSSSGGSGGATGGELRAGSFVQLKPDHYYNYTSQGRKPAGNRPDAVKITHIQEGAPYPYHLGTKDANASSASSGWRGWVRKEDLVGYDTGGYTGSWDDNEGRLAMLHQKEIVLNASDTENILKAVQAVRDMTTQLRSNIFNDIAATSAFSGSFALGSGSDTVQQEVHITAEFPNAQDSNDIREALLSLNDQAMQYSARKR